MAKKKAAAKGKPRGKANADANNSAKNNNAANRSSPATSSSPVPPKKADEAAQRNGGQSSPLAGESAKNGVPNESPRSSSSESSEFDAEAAALAAKERGNAYYKAEEYDEAIDAYTEAINHSPQTATFYGNRAAARLMLSRFRTALADARKSVELDPNFVKGYLRAGKCYHQIGDWARSRQMYEKVLQLKPTDKAAREELKQVDEAEKMVADGNALFERYLASGKPGDERSQSTTSSKPASANNEDDDDDEEEEEEKDEEKDDDDGRDQRLLLLARQQAGRVLEVAARALPAIALKCRCMLASKEYAECTKLAGAYLQDDDTYVPLLVLRGRALAYTGNIDSGLKHLQKALQLDPDNKEARVAYKAFRKVETLKREGNDFFRNKEHEQAIGKYTEALALDASLVELNSQLLANRAAAYMGLGKNEAALADLNRAIAMNDAYAKARLRRARLHKQLGNWQEAVYDYERLSQLNPRDRDLKQQLREAKKALKEANRKDYYKILGVSRDADADEIKKAYRKAALRNHPDKAPEEEREAATARFKDIGEAFSVLSDESKRRRYDRGQDLEEIEGGGGGGFPGGQPDMEELFRMFNGGGFGGMGGGGHRHGGFYF